MIRAQFLAGTGAAAGASQVAQLQPYAAPLRIGVCAPQSGDDRRIGLQLLSGVRAAIDEVNQVRTSLDRPFVYDTYDDRNTPADASVQATFAINARDVVAVIGHISASATLIAEQAYARVSMPLLVPTVTDDRITAQGYRNVFRLPTKDSDEGGLLAAYVVQTGSKAPHVVTQDGDYGQDAAAGFIRRAGTLHVNAEGTKFAIDNPNYDKAAGDVLAKKPDCVVLAGNAEDMGPLLGVLRAKGYTGRFAGTQGFFDPLTAGKLAKDAEGIIVSTSVPYYPLAPTAVRDVQDYQARYGPLTPVAAFGYAAVQLVHLATRRTGATSRVGIVRALATGGIYDTVTGSYLFAANGDVLQPNCYFYALRNGKFAYERQARPSGFMLK
jgi:branched-chain amino acid transport system substrate-binding protein